MPANLAARRSLPDVHEDLWVTTKAMYAALVGGRDEEFERLLNARERLLLETGTQQLDADSLDAGRVLRIGHKIVRAHRNHAPHVAIGPCHGPRAAQGRTPRGCAAPEP